MRGMKLIPDAALQATGLQGLNLPNDTFAGLVGNGPTLLVLPRHLG